MTVVIRVVYTVEVVRVVIGPLSAEEGTAVGPAEGGIVMDELVKWYPEEMEAGAEVGSDMTSDSVEVISLGALLRLLEAELKTADVASLAEAALETPLLGADEGDDEAAEDAETASLVAALETPLLAAEDTAELTTDEETTADDETELKTSLLSVEEAD